MNSYAINITAIRRLQPTLDATGFSWWKTRAGTTPSRLEPDFSSWFGRLDETWSKDGTGSPAEAGWKPTVRCNPPAEAGGIFEKSAEAD